MGGAPPSGKGVTREGSLANEGTSFRGMDNNFLFLWVCVCVLQVTLAYESTVLYMCEGKVLMDRSFSSASTKIIPTEMKKVNVHFRSALQFPIFYYIFRIFRKKNLIYIILAN